MVQWFQGRKMEIKQREYLIIAIKRKYRTQKNFLKKTGLPEKSLSKLFCGIKNKKVLSAIEREFSINKDKLWEEIKNGK